MNITKLLGNRIVIRRIEEPETTASKLIFIPRRARNQGQSFQAEVLMLGSDPRVPAHVRIGDKLTLLKTGSVPLGDGTEIVSCLDILGIHREGIEGPPEKEESYSQSEVENALSCLLGSPYADSWPYTAKVLRWHLKQLEAKRANP